MANEEDKMACSLRKMGGRESEKRAPSHTIKASRMHAIEGVQRGN
jgi:hypothetical protein